jgi:hypothetical protein
MPRHRRHAARTGGPNAGLVAIARRRRRAQRSTTNNSFRQLISPRPKLLTGSDVEPKFFDATNSANNTWTGIVYNTSNLPQGVGINQRVGDEIDIVGLEFRVYLTTTTVNDALRILIVQYEVDDTAGLPGAGVFLASTGNAQALIAPINFANARQEDFSILYDDIMWPPAGTVTAGASMVFGRVHHVPLKLRKRFDPAATTGNGSIYVVLVGTAVGAATSQHVLSTRLHYRDA